MIDFDGEFYYQANALDYQINIYDKKLNLVDSFLSSTKILKKVDINKNITEVIDLIYYLIGDFDIQYSRISGIQKVGEDTLYVVFSNPKDSLTKNYKYTVDTWVKNKTRKWEIQNSQMDARVFFLENDTRFYASLMMFGQTFQNSSQFFSYRYSCADTNIPINQCLEFNHYIIYNIKAFFE